MCCRTADTVSELILAPFGRMGVGPEVLTGFLFPMLGSDQRSPKMDITILKNIAFDNRISLKAKSLLQIMLLLQDHTVIRKKDLTSYCKDGYSAVTSAFSELEKKGYAECICHKTAAGTFEYSIRAYPTPLTDSDFPQRIIRSGKSATDNPQRKTSISNTEYTNTVIHNTNTEHTHTGKDNFLAPEEEEVKAYFLENGKDLKQAELFYNKNSAIGWVDKNGRKIMDWKAYAKGYWFPNIRQGTRPGSLKVVPKIEERKFVM